MNKFLKYLLTVLALLVIGLTIYSLICLYRDDSNSTTLPDDIISEKDCQDNLPLSRFPIDLSEDVIFVPLGNLNPPGHTFPTRHFYVQSTEENPKPKTLYAPADVNITNISLSHNITEDVVDYSIDYQVCEDVEGYFIHVYNLTDKLMASLPENLEDDCETSTHGDNTYKQCWAEVNIDIKAGEKLGTVWQGEYSSFDIGFTDYRVEPAKVTNEDRWPDDNLPYMVCMVDYFSDKKQEELNRRFADWSGEPVDSDEPCNKVVQDRPGTAQGVWFNSQADQSFDSEDNHLALVHDNFDPSLGAFSIGTGFEKYGINPQVLLFVPQDRGQINRDFSGVRSNNKKYCFDKFEENSGEDIEENLRIILTMPNENKLKMEIQKNKSCRGDYQFSDKAVKFER